jgi:hypothetical protein
MTDPYDTLTTFEISMVGCPSCGVQARAFAPCRPADDEGEESLSTVQGLVFHDTRIRRAMQGRRRVEMGEPREPPNGVW